MNAEWLSIGIGGVWGRVVVHGCRTKGDVVVLVVVVVVVAKGRRRGRRRGVDV